MDPIELERPSRRTRALLGLLVVCGLCASGRAAAPAARVEGGTLILVNDGKEARILRPGLEGALIVSVPLRADGTEPVIWVSAIERKATTGVMYRLEGGEPICSMPLGDGARGGHGSATRAWIFDVDGDGYNDVVVYREPRKLGSPDVLVDAVLRFDPVGRRCVAATEALRGRVPAMPPWLDDWNMGMIVQDKLALPKAHLGRGMLDAHSTVLRAPPIARIPGPPAPFVGVVSFSIAESGGMEHTTRADLHLVQFRHAPRLELVSSAVLGVAELPASFCDGGKFERFFRDGATFTARWISVGQRVLEQRATFNGERLVSAPGTAADVGSCVSNGLSRRPR